MKQLIVVSLLAGIAIIYFGCSENNPSVPDENQNARVTNELAKLNLTGIMTNEFTFTPPTFWNGTIDFGSEGIYSITFISYDPPRAYSQASPFYEDFYIYELGTNWQDPANVYLSGWDSGVLVLANNPPDSTKFVANGKIVEAYGPFEMWLDRNVHFRGFVSWVSIGLPQGAIGTIRLD